MKYTLFIGSNIGDWYLFGEFNSLNEAIIEGGRNSYGAEFRIYKRVDWQAIETKQDVLNNIETKQNE